MFFKWKFKPQPSATIIEKLKSELNISEIPAILLAGRGIFSFEEAKKFFRPSLSDLHNPFLMKDMQKAVERILKAIKNNEKILIYGDYDVDGTTAVSLLYNYLKLSGSLSSTYIPDRYSEGYGISFKGIDYAFENGFSLIIALDCGIKSVDKVAYATQKNIDFIICDHHLPDEKVPDAVAILNPKQTDCPYPYKELSGCGIGFKLIEALQQTQQKPFDEIISFLDLVAASVAADIVPITGENRTLMFFGLEVLNNNPSAGIKALLGEYKGKITVSDVVFKLAPRINAAGRIKHGSFAVELLTQTDETIAQKKALELEIFNSDRKEFDAKITHEALLQIEQNNEQNNATTVVFNPSWHKGVIGIVASRLIETYYRPTIVFTKSDEKYAASVRSVKGFDVYKALEKCSEYLEQFGGHKYAAGLTLLPENYSIFKEKFEEVVAKTLKEEHKTNQIEIDTEFPLENITEKAVAIIQQFEPFGPENMTPIFYAKNIIDTGYAKKIGKNNEHLKLTLKQQNGTKYFSAVAFNLAHKWDIIQSKKPFEIAFSIEENHWQGKTFLQLQIRDLREPRSVAPTGDNS